MNNQTVDLSNLREAIDGDKDLERELFNDFISSSQELLDTLRNADDDEEWRKSAHAFKGIAFNLGAQPLGELCMQAQENFEKDSASKQKILNEIEAEYAKVIDYLKSEV